LAARQSPDADRYRDGGNAEPGQKIIREPFAAIASQVGPDRKDRFDVHE
jgi:hypothetical protein